MKKNVGEKIKELRDIKRISREDLAARSGLDVEQIAQIEDRRIIPSLTPLIKIARSLSVRLGTFLDDYEELGPVLCRAGAEKRSASFSNTNEEARTQLDFFALASDKAGRHMEPFIINIEPTKSETFPKSSHEGEEFIYVLEGCVELSYGNDTYLLNVGDSIYYDSILNHNLHGYKGQAAKILAVVYAPE